MAELTYSVGLVLNSLSIDEIALQIDFCNHNINLDEQSFKK